MPDTAPYLASETGTVPMDWADVRCRNCHQTKRYYPLGQPDVRIVRCGHCGHDGLEVTDYRATVYGLTYGPSWNSPVPYPIWAEAV